MDVLARIKQAMPALLGTRALQVSRRPVQGPAWLDQIRDQVVALSLKKLFDCKHFSICDLEAALEAARIVPDGEVMRLLRPLHCVSWSDMPVELRKQIEALTMAMFVPTDDPPVSVSTP